MEKKPLKIVYLTPALYMAGGVERVLTLKANYFAEHFGYDITIVLTEGRDKPLFYPLSDKVKVINLDIGFEELWTCSFLKKIPVYLKKQRRYKRLLTRLLMQLRPDITVSLLRREINFLSNIHDGSRKIGELHVNRANYRNFEAGDSNIIKQMFANLWMRQLVAKLSRLDRFIVLTHEDAEAWPELSNVTVIPDPLAFSAAKTSQLNEKRVIAVGRYVYQKGFDLLFKAWQQVEKQQPDWRLDIYGMGDRQPYEHLSHQLMLDQARVGLHGPTSDIQAEYANSSLFVFSSRFEGFGMVLVEAMACGLPVISFACPCGPKDIIHDGEDGLLVENGNVDALAQAMTRVMSDAALQQQMQQAGMNNVQRFNLANIAERWQQLFEDLVK